MSFALGATVGGEVCAAVGFAEGMTESPIVGDVDRGIDGLAVESADGGEVGAAVGTATVGGALGASVVGAVVLGCEDGARAEIVGSILGAELDTKG